MNNNVLIREFFIYLICCEDSGYKINGGRPLIILLDGFFKICEKIEPNPIWFDEKSNQLEIYEELLIKYPGELKPFILSDVVSSYKTDENFINKIC